MSIGDGGQGGKEEGSVGRVGMVMLEVGCCAADRRAANMVPHTTCNHESMKRRA